MGIVCGAHAGNPDSSVRWEQNAVDLFGKCGLSGTVVPQNCHKISLFDIQGQIVDGALYLFYMVILIPTDIIVY